MIMQEIKDIALNDIFTARKIVLDNSSCAIEETQNLAKILNISRFDAWEIITNFDNFLHNLPEQ